MAYCPEEDILVTHPRRTNRYVQGIESAVRRLDLLTKYLASKMYGLSSACIELAFSIKHHLRMSKNINMSMKDPSNIVKENIDHIEEVEQQLSAIIPFKNLPENRAKVPSISPYKLAIQIIIENCTRTEQVMDAIDLMS